MNFDSTEPLIEQARAVAEKAYAPYSSARVGCALETVAGHIFTGCNVENASFGLTVCAERNAVFQAVAAEGPKMSIRKLAVIALGHEFPPCGACRQVIAEFAIDKGDTEIIWWQGGRPTSMRLRDLLPCSFRFEK